MRLCPVAKHDSVNWAVFLGLLFNALIKYFPFLVPSFVLTVNLQGCYTVNRVTEACALLCLDPYRM